MTTTTAPRAQTPPPFTWVDQPGVNANIILQAPGNHPADSITIEAYFSDDEDALGGSALVNVELSPRVTLVRISELFGPVGVASIAREIAETAHAWITDHEVMNIAHTPGTAPLDGEDVSMWPLASGDLADELAAAANAHLDEMKIAAAGEAQS